MPNRAMSTTTIGAPPTQGIQDTPRKLSKMFNQVIEWRVIMRIYPLISVFLFTVVSTVFAADGPNPVIWIPGADVVETVGSLTGVRRQPGHSSGRYNARDVFKTFVPAVTGKDLRLVVTGPEEKVDYFDEMKDNGLYAVFGAVDPGTITLDYQWRVMGVGTFVSAGTRVLTIDPKRTLIYDTADVPINVWYTVYDDSVNPVTSQELAIMLDTDFKLIAGQGFTAITFINNPNTIANWQKIVFSKAVKYNLKVQMATGTGPSPTTESIIDGHRYMRAHNDLPRDGNPAHDIPLLEMENALISAGLNTDVGGGVLMKSHPRLWSFYTYDEPYGGQENALELALMMTKSIAPNRSGAFAIGGYGGPNYGPSLVGKTMFSDFTVAESYPFRQVPPTPTSDFSHNYGPSNVPLWPSIPKYLSNLRNYDPRRYVENISQAFSASNFRAASPKELRAMTLIGAARGVRPFTYFSFRTFGGVSCMLNGSNVPENGQWAEAKLINIKLRSWMPIYKNLGVSSTGSTPITYAVNGGVVGNFIHRTTGDRYLIVVNTDTINTKTVSVSEVINKTNNPATTATDVQSGTMHPITGGVLNINFQPGDGALLGVN